MLPLMLHSNNRYAFSHLFSPFSSTCLVLFYRILTFPDLGIHANSWSICCWASDGGCGTLCHAIFHMQIPCAAGNITCLVRFDFLSWPRTFTKGDQELAVLPTSSLCSGNWPKTCNLSRVWPTIVKGKVFFILDFWQQKTCFLE